MKRFTTISIIISYIMLLFVSCASGAFPILSISGKKMFEYSNYYVLVVGVGSYDRPGWPRLEHAIQDAKAIAEFFKKYESFEVKLLLDPTSTELNNTLKNLKKVIGQKKDQAVLFYFTGHGYTEILPDQKKQGWIIPKDSPTYKADTGAFREKAISIEKIDSIMTDLITGQMARHILLIFDSAFTDTVSIMIERPSFRPIDETSGEPVIQYIITGTEGDATWGAERFFELFMEGVKGAASLTDKRYIPGSELGTYIFMVTHGKQRPQYGKTSNGRSQRGNFVFFLKEKPLLCISVSPKSAKVSIIEKDRALSDEECITLDQGTYTLEAESPSPFYTTEKREARLNSGDKKLESFTLNEAEEYTNSIGMRFRLVKTGEFSMGSPEREPGRSGDEAMHNVRITKKFYMQSTEVTIGQFKRFMNNTRYLPESESSGCWVANENGQWDMNKKGRWSDVKSGVSGSGKPDDNHPVTCVSWNDANRFIEWLNKTEKFGIYSLPSEAEWEYACRAGSKGAFSSGNCLTQKEANFSEEDGFFSDCPDPKENLKQGTKRVASLSANKWGLYDMHGNVLEWCKDWYGPYKKTANYLKGPDRGTERVLRGGHWRSGLSGLRSAKRWSLPPETTSDVAGFRVILRPE